MKHLALLVKIIVFIVFCPGCTANAAAASEPIGLQTLDLTKLKQGWGRPKADASVTGKSLSLNGRQFAHGVGTHAPSTLWIELGGGCKRFRAVVGIDDSAGERGSVRFRVIGDGKPLFDSGVVSRRTPPKELDLDLTGVKRLLLQVTDAGDGHNSDHADWAEAYFIGCSQPPQAIDRPIADFPKYILTPNTADVPRINGPLVYGCRPGRPFLYRIPTTGIRPMAFAAENLPPGITLDAENGILRGTSPPQGEYLVTLRAVNNRGRAERTLKIVSGPLLALTPPMGWNHWYAHYHRVTDKMVREAADAMVASGMADVGYQYVCIDDCWMNAPAHSDPLRVGPLRDTQGDIVPNRHFPDMKALTDYIHSKGLKAGIYTSPGPLTCAKFAGSYGYEQRDARRFAEWGFDFLKYDWCSYENIAKQQSGTELEKLQRPYRLMGSILREQPRDIVFNLCQYGMGEVWRWGAEVGGHSWRTAGDLGFELEHFFEVALRNAQYRQWSRPGAWNDPDYIQIGYIGDARTAGAPKPCPLIPDEQYAFMSLWCLSAAPLFYSGDMSRLDAFTLNVLCNPEVIEIDQDPLGQCGRVIICDKAEDLFLMVKDLHDGSKAVGLFNRGWCEGRISARWADLAVVGPQAVRDLWRQKDLGIFDDCFESVVPARGVVLVRLSAAR